LRGDYYKIAENLNAVGELFRGSGIKFCYHNHAFEFELSNGEVPLEIMIKETQPDLVSFEADLYWVKKGGTEPMDLINKYPGRFSLFHVKDANPNLDQTTVGEGIIEFETIINAKETAGLEYYF
ncbi:MAG: TIM barrel protein, partial [Cyclobacteriaceae bacterium]|nr:TIM barrel protein [Cyclobacteriaceae bacterium]